MPFSKSCFNYRLKKSLTETTVPLKFAEWLESFNYRLKKSLTETHLRLREDELKVLASIID